MHQEQSISEQYVRSEKDTESVRQERICFVISPIGSTDSEVRRRADNVRDFVIRPALEPLGFQVMRADDVADPGLIMQQIVDTTVTAEVVIADLTGLNPNVLYELAVRHETGRPVITIAESGTSLPFDVNQVRTIFFDHTDLRSVNETKQRIIEQLHAATQPGYQQSNPITLAKQLKEWNQSANRELHASAVILSALSELSARLNRLESTVGATQILPWRLFSESDELNIRSRMAEELLGILNNAAAEMTQAAIGGSAQNSYREHHQPTGEPLKRTENS